jgi:hypothetical protein
LPAEALAKAGAASLMKHIAIVFACGLLFAAAVSAQVQYVQSVFVGTSKGPVELIAYAELLNNGRMSVASGHSIEDVPIVETVQRILCSLPNWKVSGVWLAGDAIFRDDRAERRQMTVASRMLNVYTIELRIADLEDSEKVARLVRLR